MKHNMMAWTTTGPYQDGRGFQCIDTYFGTQYQFTLVSDGETIWREYNV